MRHDYFLFELTWELGVVKGGTYTYLWGKSAELNKKNSHKHVLVGPFVPEAFSSGELQQIPIEDLPKELSNIASIAAKLNLPVYIARWAKAGNAYCILIDYHNTDITFAQMSADLATRYRLINNYTKVGVNLEKLNKELMLWSYLAGKFMLEVLAQCNFSGKKIVVEAHYPYGVSLEMLHFERNIADENAINLHNTATIRTLHATHLGYLSTFTAARDWIENLDAPNFELLHQYFNTDEYTVEHKEILDADYVVGISRPMSEEILRYYYRRVDFFCPHGIDTAIAEIAPPAKTASLATRESNLQAPAFKQKEFFTAGRDIDLIKGYELILAALGRLDKELVAINYQGEVRHSFYILINSADAERFNETLSRELLSRNVIYFNAVENGLYNSPQNKVKINLVVRQGQQVQDANYFAKVAASDLAVFPSLYEPWGYTPMESLMLNVPTVTTSKSGLSAYLTAHPFFKQVPGLYSLDLTKPRAKVIEQLLGIMLVEAVDEKQGVALPREVAKGMSWANQIDYYTMMYETIAGK